MPMPSKIKGPLLITCVDHFHKESTIDGQTLLEINGEFRNSHEDFTLEESFALAYNSPVIANRIIKSKKFAKQVKLFKKSDKKTLEKNDHFNLDLAFEILQRKYRHDLEFLMRIEKIKKDKILSKNNTEQLFLEYVVNPAIDIELAQTNLQYLLSYKTESCIAIKCKSNETDWLKAIVEDDKDLNDLYIKAIERAREKEVLKPHMMAQYVKIANLNYLNNILNPSIFDRVGAILGKIASFTLANSKTTHEYIDTEMLVNRIEMEFAPETPGLDEKYDKIKLIASFLERRFIGKNYWEKATAREWSTIIYLLRSHREELPGEIDRLLQLAKERYATKFKIKLNEVVAQWDALPASNFVLNHSNFVRQLNASIVAPADAQDSQPAAVQVVGAEAQPPLVMPVAPSSPAAQVKSASLPTTPSAPFASPAKDVVRRGLLDFDNLAPPTSHSKGDSSLPKSLVSPVAEHSASPSPLMDGFFAAPEQLSSTARPNQSSPAVPPISTQKSLDATPTLASIFATPEHSGAVVQSTQSSSANRPVTLPGSSQHNDSGSSSVLATPVAQIRRGYMPAASPSSPTSVPSSDKRLTRERVGDVEKESMSPLFRDLFATPDANAKSFSAQSELPGIMPSPREEVLPASQVLPPVELVAELPQQNAGSGSPLRQPQPVAVEPSAVVPPLAIPSEEEVPGILASPRAEVLPASQVLQQVELVAELPQQNAGSGSPLRQPQSVAVVSPAVVPVVSGSHLHTQPAAAELSAVVPPLAMPSDEEVPGILASPRAEVLPASQVLQQVELVAELPQQNAGSGSPLRQSQPAIAETQTVVPVVSNSPLQPKPAAVESSAVVPPLVIPSDEEVPGILASPRAEVLPASQVLSPVELVAEVTSQNVGLGSPLRQPQPAIAETPTVVPVVSSSSPLRQPQPVAVEPPAVVSPLAMPSEEEVPGILPTSEIAAEVQSNSSFELPGILASSGEEHTAAGQSNSSFELPGILASPNEKIAAQGQLGSPFDLPGLLPSPLKETEAEAGFVQVVEVSIPPVEQEDDIPGLRPSIQPELVASSMVPSLATLPRDKDVENIPSPLLRKGFIIDSPADSVDMKSPAYVSPSTLKPRSVLPRYQSSPSIRTMVGVPGITLYTPPHITGLKKQLKKARLHHLTGVTPPASPTFDSPVNTKPRSVSSP